MFLGNLEKSNRVMDTTTEKKKCVRCLGKSTETKFFLKEG